MTAAAVMFPHPVVLVDNAIDGYIETHGWIEATGEVTQANAAEKLVDQLGPDYIESVRPSGAVTGPHALVPLLWNEGLDRDTVVLPGQSLTAGEEERVRWERLADYPAAAYALPFWRVEFVERDE